MKKFGFLVPVVTAAAALSSPAEAKVDASATVEAAKTGTTAASALGGTKETFYVKDGERHSLLMKLSESGQMLAWHSSHSSHGSHGSHGSHSSHRSGY